MVTSATHTLQIILLLVWLILCQVESCEGQMHPGLYGSALPPVPHYPTGGVYGAPYHRPAYSQSYGYSYSNSQLRATDNSEEALDSAQKAAMAPMNNVVSSLPIKADLASMLPYSLPAVFQASQGRDASTNPNTQNSRQCGGPNGKCPADLTTHSETTPAKTETQGVNSQQQGLQQSQQQAPSSNRQLPVPSSPCVCPCSYYGWMYGGFPFYDLSHLSSYPKESSSQAYTYAYPYAYTPEKASSRSARTFWLPWAQPAPPTVQNPYGRPGGSQFGSPYLSNMYYGRRY